MREDILKIVFLDGIQSADGIDTGYSTAGAEVSSSLLDYSSALHYTRMLYMTGIRTNSALAS